MRYLVLVVLICTMALGTPVYIYLLQVNDPMTEEDMDRRTIILPYVSGEVDNLIEGDILIFHGKPAYYGIVGAYWGVDFKEVSISIDSALTDVYDLLKIDEIANRENFDNAVSYRNVKTNPADAFINEELFMVYRKNTISEGQLFHVLHLIGGIIMFFIFFFGLSVLSTLPLKLKYVLSSITVSFLVWKKIPFIGLGMFNDFVYGSDNLCRLYLGLSIILLILFCYLLDRFLPKNENPYISQAIKFFSLCFFCLVSIFLVLSIIGWFYPELKLLLIYKRGRIDYSLLSVFYYFVYLFALARLLVFTINRYRLLKKEKEAAISSKLSTTAQLNSLQARLNSHFLYNSLNSIASLIKSEPDKAEEMTLSVSRFLKHFSNRESDHMTLLREEIDMIEEYLAIEKIRFGESLSYDINIESIAYGKMVPRSLLQPLVENAIKYGYSTKQSAVHIGLDVRIKEDDMIISISDSGPAWDEDLQKGYGLSSVYNKLSLIYGDDHDVSFVNEPEKKIVIIIATDKVKTYD